MSDSLQVSHLHIIGMEKPCSTRAVITLIVVEREIIFKWRHTYDCCRNPVLVQMERTTNFRGAINIRREQNSVLIILLLDENAPYMNKQTVLLKNLPFIKELLMENIH